MKQAFWLAMAGGIGALARHYLSSAVYALCGRAFPWGTFFVNIAGCFLFGLIVSLAECRRLISDEMRLVLLVGFMGSFTTFSSFIADSDSLLQRGGILPTGLNLAGEILLGFLLFHLGLRVGRI